MHSAEWLRSLTERQRQVLSIVVENKVYRNRDSRISELAAELGVAPAAVTKHLLEIEKTALLHVVVTPSEQGKRVYERLQLEPRPRRPEPSEVLDDIRTAVLQFLKHHPEATAGEISEELALSEYATTSSLRILSVVGLIEKRRGPAVRRGAPPFVHRLTPHGETVLGRA